MVGGRLQVRPLLDSLTKHTTTYPYAISFRVAGWLGRTKSARASELESHSSGKAEYVLRCLSCPNVFLTLPRHLVADALQQRNSLRSERSFS
jgi:hypothetical protein